MSPLSRLWLLVLLCAVLGVVWLFQPSPRPEEKEPTSPEEAEERVSQSIWRESIEERFAFDEACAECHQEQYEAHQRSGHSRTATRVENASPFEELLGETYRDPRRDQTFRFQKRDGLVLAGIEGVDREPAFPVHWLLGSGTHARTPVSIDPQSGMGVEFRWTWFAHSGEWDLTPDHERFDDYRPGSLECFGRPLQPGQALACMGCHMTVVPPSHVPPTPEAFVPNVGCERCHGPRKNHVELAHQGRAAEAKPYFLYDDPETYIRQCAQCHRDETNIPENTPAKSLARYQPYGLLKSACYLKSGKGLTCSNCHDPHDHAAKSREKSLRACAVCHSAPDQVHCSVPVQQSAGDCITCHMPAVEWHSGISFHDHWIRVPEGKDSTDRAP